MNNLVNRTSFFTLSIATTAFLMVSNVANAEIYKWRDNKGKVQYSDKPPVTGFTKADRHELVNALQAKDLCAVPTTKIAAAATVTKNVNANFFGINSGPTILSQPTNVLGLPTTQQTTTVATTSPTTTSTSTTSPTTTSTTTTTTTSPTTTSPTTTSTTTTSPTTTTTTSATGTTTSPTTTTTTTTSATGTSPNILQTGLMPAVDLNKLIVPTAGYNTLRVQATTEIAPVSTIGAFRISCKPSHMSNDDPLVYPNQQGATHLHTFFGNTSVNYKSNLATLSTTGNSTCNGGTMNRSAYWAPTMIDTATKTPVVPEGTSFYYKRGYIVPKTAIITTPPAGLRMLAGNPKATTATDGAASYICNYASTTSSRTKNIQNCAVGGIMQMTVLFPQCWDGKNLDSPNHKDHMAFPRNSLTTANKCPTTHPVALPEITMNMNFKITKANQAATWRLASDNYAAGATNSNAGYSGHADWVDGWDRTFITNIVKNCINGKRDGHNHLLCDGRKFY